jgi:hypothetical protein
VTTQGNGGMVAGSMHPLHEDPWIAAQVEAAVAPYQGRLSDAELSWMRDQLAETLASDKKADLLLRRAHPVQVDESGEVRRDAGHDGGGLRPQTPAHDATRRKNKKAG